MSYYYNKVCLVQKGTDESLLNVDMKKTILYILIGLLMPLAAVAQSSMTDDQVMRFVLKEHEAGTSQQQIVTKLMQRGVDIQQIRRVKKIA